MRAPGSSHKTFPSCLPQHMSLGLNSCCTVSATKELTEQNRNDFEKHESVLHLVRGQVLAWPLNDQSSCFPGGLSAKHGPVRAFSHSLLMRGDWYSHFTGVESEAGRGEDEPRPHTRLISHLWPLVP